MPIYEYKCDEGHAFEAFQAISDEALSSCTVCGAPAQRVLSAPAIHFKGSGFYTTDYGAKSKSRVGGSGSESGESGSSGEGSSDSGSNGSGSDSGSGDSGSSKSSGDGASKSTGDSAKSAA